MQDWKGGGGGLQQIISQSPKRNSSAAPQMANIGKVKFHPPNVPVIFILGGPGSGKVTHCDTLMQEKRGVTHINMMDLLQQYAMGNGSLNFFLLFSIIHNFPCRYARFFKATIKNSYRSFNA